jgi:hypothetical protein
MIRHWLATIARFVTSLEPELIWADSVGPFVDRPVLDRWHPDAPETPEDEEARLDAMLTFMMFM